MVKIMKDSIYIYIMNKKIENTHALYEKTKSKYEVSNKSLTKSLDAYVGSSGKSNKEERLLTAFLLLESVFNLTSVASVATPISFEKDSMGKPGFGKSDVKLSIAHNEDYAVVAYAIGREIGIDIEREIDFKKAENLSGRFSQISSLDIENKENENRDVEKIIFLEIKENGSFESMNLELSDNSFSAKWTAAEAIMKCDGRGFSVLSELQKIKKDINVFALLLHHENKKNYISLAVGR